MKKSHKQAKPRAASRASQKRKPVTGTARRQAGKNKQPAKKATAAPRAEPSQVSEERDSLRAVVARLRDTLPGAAKLIDYEEMIVALNQMVRSHVPRSGTLLVINKGDGRLLAHHAKAWHFPRNADGTYTWQYPAEDYEAIDHLESLCAAGAGFLLVPQTALWWMEHYPLFAEHLEQRFKVHCREEAGVLFDLRHPRKLPALERATPYQQLTQRMRKVVTKSIPAGSVVAVVSKGDGELLKLDGVTAWHFPQGKGGVYAGHHPAKCADAIAHLEELRRRGADYLVLPSTAFWWLDSYGEFARHLAGNCHKIVDDSRTCIIYRLGANEGGQHSAANVARLIAFFLPQFHPIPENDRWWGKGFTEWTNVAKAKALFPGHYQPHVPADLGQYDLRSPETREAQAKLAVQYGIHGFCYYHYWFHGKRLLEQPVQEILSSGKPEFPFCLCWANEAWSRRWDGSDKDILQPQSYSDADDIEHIRTLIPALADPRAILIEGKPVFLVYRAKDLPQPARTAETWRREVAKAGLKGIFLIAVENSWDLDWDATKEGFDAKVLFQPRWNRLSLLDRIPIKGKPDLRVYDYEQAAQILSEPDSASYRRYETVFPTWDNSPRTGDRAFVFHNATPEAYGRWLREAVARVQSEPADHRVVFINAWNEWAEGAHLEPDRRHGHAWLEATRGALAEVAGMPPSAAQSIAVPTAAVVREDTATKERVRPRLTQRDLPLFDEEWYLDHYPDVRASGKDALTHYLDCGAAEGRDPHPLFDTKWYLEQNPEVARANLNPLEHYTRTGVTKGCAPHAAFDPKFYWKTYPGSILVCHDPLRHYLTEGWKKGHRPNPKFDPRFYLSTYPDIAEAGIEPLTHFITAGLKEGRVGSPDDLHLEPFEADVEISRAEAPATKSPLDTEIKAIAFYLPQFHPIPENDAWWGSGFTEWTNVRRGTPQFPGHDQPRVPAGLGYYDLRQAEVLEKQASLARTHGIFGFCFYYYWFAGKVLLDLPIRRILKTGRPDFPFCICWANENWTRRWDGLDREILIAQKHSPEDDLAFIRNVEPILLHGNYIRIGGKPLLLIYRPSLLPDAKATIARWRSYFRDRGHGELYIAMTRSFHDPNPAEAYGLDAGIQFPPQIKTTPVTYLMEGKEPSFQGIVYDYEQTKKAFIEELWNQPKTGKLHPAVMPSWDNTARRRSNASIWTNSSPESYHDWLSAVATFLRARREPDDRFAFINAWNEWAEGCYLEPDQKFGHACLNATRLALKKAGKAKPRARPAHGRAAVDPRSGDGNVPLEVLFVSHDAYPHGAQYVLLILTNWLKKQGLVRPRFIMGGSGSLLEEFSRVGPVLQLDSALLSADRDRALRLLRSFCGKGISAVYLNSAASGHMAELTRHLNVPHIAHIHELEKSIQRWVAPEKMVLLRKHTHRFIAVSPAVEENLIRNHQIPAQKVQIVHAFISCTGLSEISLAGKKRCRTALGIRPDAKVVLGCGTTDWRKGPDLFVQVAAEVVAGYKRPVEFVWVGAETRAGEIRELEEMVAAKGLKGRVRFTGALATPLPYMLASDVFLLPSREDPFPLVCLEAADCGLPVICFADAGGMPDFVGSKHGAVVPYLDIESMAGSLTSLLVDTAKARVLRNQARESVRREFDVSVKAREIYDLVKSLCSTK